MYYMKGKTLGSRYTILEEVGDGGMAIVYKAKCNLLDRIVAIKVLKPEFSEDEDFVRRFRREAQSAASLSHPNIVGIYDVGEEDGLHYIVMEYVEGKTLKQLIKEKSPMQPMEVIDYGKQICDALECAHRNKIVHRDIKSQNIMITPDGRVKVMDFGIARAATGTTITNTGNVFGSVQYFSPEQAKSDFVDERSDIYSLGIVLYEAFTGELPFNGQTPVAIALKQIQQEPKSISSLIPGFPRKLELIVQKCMSKSPNDRFQNAKELKSELVKAAACPDVINFKHMDLDHTLVMNKIPDNHDNTIISEFDNSEEINPRPKSKKRMEPLKVIGIAVALILIFAIFSYIGGVLAKKYFEVPETFVPDVIGLTEEKAVEKLTQEDLKYEIERVNHDSPEGQVIDQDPKPNERVKINSIVNIVVSRGPKENQIPLIIGLSEQEALVSISDNGFEPGRIKRENSEEYPEGIVIDQNPMDGLSLPRGTKINFTVSLGPAAKQEKIPTVIGRTIDEAQKILKEQGIAIGNTFKKPSDAPENIVIAQDPNPGTLINKDGSATVNLTVSSGPVELKKFNLPIILPADPQEFNIKVIISDELGKRTVYNRKHKPEDSPLTVPIEGAGTINVEVFLDDILYIKETY
jgi:serine/threonine protein kinase/beta-lactam-binding protein with PASTA domain